MSESTSSCSSYFRPVSLQWYIAADWHGNFKFVSMTLPSAEVLVMRGCAEWDYAGMIFRVRSLHHTSISLTKNGTSDYQWTRTHGLSALMGGFVPQGGTQRKRTVLRTRRNLRRLRDERTINPTITNDEIRDKSKADGIGKALLVLQLSCSDVRSSHESSSRRGSYELAGVDFLVEQADFS
ncbi:hypothetical protein PAXRUDRAFT_147625 [Paxillus rubicundulus Ve08.2h10]|uniref:Uncharacterized protein n=1 Tax=Paxillus rubicundulus Ve08.2h10 TaxID=930991 RepID=A0A0D0DZA4_9AGAM|nr:hypothetical protein PAXRUDRAFT_147625 [Paxillus rubicundulus Ve08.2h10]